MPVFRCESDLIGEKKIPKDAYYGIFTQRALENFNISKHRIHPYFIKNLAVIKKAAAETNRTLGYLDPTIASAIITSAEEVIQGKHIEEFKLDVFQAGAGTPWNMNINEVVANRANEKLGFPLGTYSPIHPNDHVNMSQSSNDVIPNTIRLTYLQNLPKLIYSLKNLEKGLHKKANQFKDHKKAARTHLRDAVPITLGQEFMAYANTVHEHRKQIIEDSKKLRSLSIGGTAVGTGLNTHPDYPKLVVKFLSKETGIELSIAPDKIQKTQFMNNFLSQINRLSELASSILKICNDLMLISSGPASGLAEIDLPPVEPGSSIMPGKINPSILECVAMVCYQVQGNRHTIELATQAGNLDLNVYTPLIAYNLLDSQIIISNAIKIFDERCIKGITANTERLKKYFENTTAIATVFSPAIGYDKASKLVLEAEKKGTPVIELIINKGLLTREEVKKLVDSSTGPNRGNNQ